MGAWKTHMVEDFWKHNVLNFYARLYSISKGQGQEGYLLKEHELPQ